MKKLLTVTALVLVFALTLTACGVKTNLTAIKATEEISLGLEENGTIDVSFDTDNQAAAAEDIEKAIKELGGVTFESANEQIATVDINGVVTAVGGGRTVVNIKAGDLTAKTSINVIVPIEKILVIGTITTYVGDESVKTVGASIIPSEAAGQEITFTSSDESIVTVDEKGQISPQGVGEATITTECEGVQATTKVIVSAAK